MTKNQNSTAAAGNPDTTRRAALGAIVGAVALTCAPAEVRAGESAPSAELLGLIEKKASAFEAYGQAIDHLHEVERSYFEANSKFLYVPLTIGGAEERNIAYRIDEAFDDFKASITTRYGEVSRLKGLSYVAPELAEQGRVALAGALQADLRRLRRLINAERRKRRVFGLVAAEKARDDAQNADDETLGAICAFRCLTPADVQAKALALREWCSRFHGGLTEEHFDALIASMLPEGGAA